MFGFTKVNYNEVGPCTILFTPSEDYDIEDFTYFPAWEDQLEQGDGGLIATGSIILDVESGDKYIATPGHFDGAAEEYDAIYWVKIGSQSGQFWAPFDKSYFEHQFDEEIDEIGI